MSPNIQPPIPNTNPEKPFSLVAGMSGDAPPMTVRLSILDSRQDEVIGKVEAWLANELIGFVMFSEFSEEDKIDFSNP